MPKNTQSSVPSSHFQQKSTADYMQLPFWCGILPDKDAKALLNHKNEFLLRQLEDRNAVCITVARKKNKIIDVPVVKDNGYRLHSQPHLKKKLRELIEFYWCTKYAIRYQNKKLRLEVPIMRPKWMLCEANVKQGKTLGAGAYGIVVKAELYELGQRRAVAVKKLVGQVPDEELSNLWEEARIMKNMAHKNIITFYGIVNDCKPFYIVIELVNGGSVDKYLQKEGKNSDNKTRLRILIDGSKGMKYLHSQNPPFLHLDFAARNLLINWTSTLFKTRQNMVIKVADFGLSKRTTRAKIDSSQPTNIRWMDPHSFVTERVDKWTDIWAFAITMFELFVRPYQIPYHGWEAQKVFDEVIAPIRGQRKRLDRPSRMPIHVHEIMKSCMLLDEKREQRPTFVQLQGLLETAFKKLD